MIVLVHNPEVQDVGGVEPSASSAPVGAGPECDVPSEGHPSRKDISKLQEVHRRVTRMVRDLHASGTGSGNPRRLPGRSGAFQGKRGRDPMFSNHFKYFSD